MRNVLTYYRLGGSSFCNRCQDEPPLPSPSPSPPPEYDYVFENTSSGNRLVILNVPMQGTNPNGGLWTDYVYITGISPSGCAVVNSATWNGSFFGETNPSDYNNGKFTPEYITYLTETGFNYPLYDANIDNITITYGCGYTYWRIIEGEFNNDNFVPSAYEHLSGFFFPLSSDSNDPSYPYELPLTFIPSGCLGNYCEEPTVFALQFGRAQVSDPIDFGSNVTVWDTITTWTETGGASPNGYTFSESYGYVGPYPYPD